MSAADDHLAQARSNLRLFLYLVENGEVLGPGALQWAVTIGFYVAVHCVEAHLRAAGLAASSSHRDRASKMARLGIPYDVVDSYKQLQQWSEQARYLMGQFEAGFIRDQVLTEVRTVLQFAGIAEPTTD